MQKHCKEKENFITFSIFSFTFCTEMLFLSNTKKKKLKNSGHSIQSVSHSAITIITINSRQVVNIAHTCLSVRPSVHLPFLLIHSLIHLTFNNHTHFFIEMSSEKLSKYIVYEKANIFSVWKIQ